MRNDGINDVLMWISKLMPWSVAGEAYSGWPRFFTECIYIYIYIYYFKYIYIYVSPRFPIHSEEENRLFCICIESIWNTTHVACHFEWWIKAFSLPDLIYSSDLFHASKRSLARFDRLIILAARGGDYQTARRLGSPSEAGLQVANHWRKSKKSPFLMAKFVWINEFEPLTTFKKKCGEWVLWRAVLRLVSTCHRSEASTGCALVKLVGGGMTVQDWAPLI